MRAPEEIGDLCVALGQLNEAHLEIRRLRALNSEASNAANLMIRGLLRHRDFLGLQLAHACGHVGDAVFEAHSEDHFKSTPRISGEEVSSLIPTILTTLGIAIDASTFSDVLGCSFEDAELAIQEFVRTSNIEESNGEQH